MRHLLKLLTILMLLTGLFLPYSSVLGGEESPTPEPSSALPRPHIDYGIHVAPHTPTDLSWVDRLNMNWVKVYTYEQAEQFRNRMVLFRMDMNFPNDWEGFKREVRARTQEIVARGVEAVEVHNEPNLSLEWGGRPPNAWQYTQMLRVAYTEIKAVAPQLIVVSGGLAPTSTTPDKMAISDIDFAREMFDNGAGDYFDVFGYHPYGYDAPPEAAPAVGRLNFRRSELIRSLMLDFDINKPIWLTEFGWLRDPAEDGVDCADSNPAFAGFAWLRVSGETQADYIVRAFDYADRNWEWAGPMFLWNLNWSQIPAQSLNICSHMRWFSILKSNGDPTVALGRVAAMPRRPASTFTPTPELELVANDMTVEVGETCPGVVEVGEFRVVNAGFGGTFTATIETAKSLAGPEVIISTETADPGDVVVVYADTTGLEPDLYVIFINVRTEILGRRVVQNVRGYIHVTDGFGGCN